jgi:hypothetical protein
MSFFLNNDAGKISCHIIPSLILIRYLLQVIKRIYSDPVFASSCQFEMLFSKLNYNWNSEKKLSVVPMMLLQWTASVLWCHWVWKLALWCNVEWALCGNKTPSERLVFFSDWLVAFICVIASSALWHDHYHCLAFSLLSTSPRLIRLCNGSIFIWKLMLPTFLCKSFIAIVINDSCT